MKSQFRISPMIRQRPGHNPNGGLVNLAEFRGA